jgi:2-polyprenyl-3-methyl-5-hydroxy-6-metoxy-1,4-benzoquinol methylase
MDTAAQRFETYALDSAAKFRSEAADRLASNRMKLWRRAYRPLLPEIAGARRVLDFGCGSGDFLLFLNEVTDAEVTGFDPSRSQIELARSRCGGIPRIRLASEESGLDGRFDLVFSNHVIEHVPDPELPAFLRAMLDRVAPRGKLVVATPNGLNPLAYAFYMSSDSTHLRMHSPLTLSELFRPFGYEVKETHRELPQAYDLPSLAKTCVWWIWTRFLWLALCSVAGGVRGLRFRLELAPTIYCVIQKQADRRAQAA